MTINNNENIRGGFLYRESRRRTPKKDVLRIKRNETKERRPYFGVKTLLRSDDEQENEDRRSNIPSFKGGYDLDSTQNWIRELEKIFYTMECTNGQKVTFSDYVLVEEVEHWWENTRAHMEVEYFPRNVKSKKEMEFLELKQGNMFVAIYLAKFEELSRCKIYDEDNMARVAYFKNMGLAKEKRFRGQRCSKPYSILPSGQGRSRRHMLQPWEARPYDKSIVFGKLAVGKDEKFIAANQAKAF
ncbi:hypothetical protein CR513_29283, partial [Mucuna pruriens]